jgi:hypothetical protein
LSISKGIEMSEKSFALRHHPLAAGGRVAARALVSAVLAPLVLAAAPSWAQDRSFAGEWEMDLPRPAAAAGTPECGRAGFRLKQSGTRITGEHWLVAPGCGDINEGGEGSVSGAVHGNAAVLVVTSALNGQVLRGRAMLEGDRLRWKVLQEMKPGTPAGDGLILQEGVLRKVKVRRQRNAG